MSNYNYVVFPELKFMEAAFTKQLSLTAKAGVCVEREDYWGLGHFYWGLVQNFFP